MKRKIYDQSMPIYLIKLKFFCTFLEKLQVKIIKNLNFDVS